MEKTKRIAALRKSLAMDFDTPAKLLIADAANDLGVSVRQMEKLLETARESS